MAQGHPDLWWLSSSSCSPLILLFSCLSFFFFPVMLSFHSPPTHCCSPKLSQGWTPHCLSLQGSPKCIPGWNFALSLTFLLKEERSCLGQLHIMHFAQWLKTLGAVRSVYHCCLLGFGVQFEADEMLQTEVKIMSMTMFSSKHYRHWLSDPCLPSWFCCIYVICLPMDHKPT